jgi:hypothetical protein
MAKQNKGQKRHTVDPQNIAHKTKYCGTRKLIVIVMVAEGYNVS